MDLLIGFFINIISNIAYDEIKRNFPIFHKQNLRKAHDEIATYIQENIDLDRFNFDNLESVISYLQLPQVTDLMYDYIRYELSGVYKSSIKNALRQKSNSVFESVVEYIVNGYITYIEKAVRSISKTQVRSILREIQKILVNYLLSSLDETQNAQMKQIV